MKTLKQIFVIISSICALFSCKNPNGKFYSKFENEFNDSIKKNKAEEFVYNYDILQPQKSYFVKSKIKFLTITGSGEFCDGEANYIFNEKNDSILFQFRRQICYKNPDRWEIETDIIYVIDYLKKIEEKYSNGKLIKKERVDNLNEYDRFAYEVKLHTEKKYNSR